MTDEHGSAFDPDDLDARAQRFADELEKAELPKMPDLHEDAETKIKELERRAQIARGIHDVATGKPRSSKIDVNADKGMAHGLSAAFGLLAMPIFGFLVGTGIESVAGGNWKLPLAGAGIVLGFLYMIVLLNKANK